MNPKIPFDILKIAEIFGLYDECIGMEQGTRFYFRKQWKDIV